MKIIQDRAIVKRDLLTKGNHMHTAGGAKKNAWIEVWREKKKNPVERRNNPIFQSDLLGERADKLPFLRG